MSNVRNNCAPHLGGMLRLATPLHIDAYHWNMCANIQLLISVQTRGVPMLRGGGFSAFGSEAAALFFSFFFSLSLSVHFLEYANCRISFRIQKNTHIWANTRLFQGHGGLPSVWGGGWRGGGGGNILQEKLPGLIHPSTSELPRPYLTHKSYQRILCLQRTLLLLPDSFLWAADIKLGVEAKAGSLVCFFPPQAPEINFFRKAPLFCRFCSYHHPTLPLFQNFPSGKKKKRLQNLIILVFPQVERSGRWRIGVWLLIYPPPRKWSCAAGSNCTNTICFIKPYARYLIYLHICAFRQFFLGAINSFHLLTVVMFIQFVRFTRPCHGWNQSLLGDEALKIIFACT